MDNIYQLLMGLVGKQGIDNRQEAVDMQMDAAKSRHESADDESAESTSDQAAQPELDPFGDQATLLASRRPDWGLRRECRSR